MKIKNKLECKNYNSGITLIALVITITILLIVAGITVGAITGENGLINKAIEGKDSSDIAHERDILEQAIANARGKSKYGDVEKELIEIELNDNKEIESVNEDEEGIVVVFKSGRSYVIGTKGNVTKQETGGGGSSAPMEAVTENTEYTDTNKDTAIIPKGFRVSSHKDSNGNYDEQTIETGLVVLDGNDNEWVWIPVPDASVMYTKNNTGIAITGGSGKTYVTGVTTNYYSNGEIKSGITRGLPNTTSYREPDVVVGTGAKYDGVESNRATAGFTKTVNETTTTMTISEMAQSLVDDYEEMIESVKDNHGFYVGRYELKGTNINSAEEKAGVVMTNKTWYQLYYACKHINTGTATVGAVEPRMIWGCQWDMVCNFIANHGDKKTIGSSADWGNYKDSTGNAAISGKSGSKHETGFSEYWCANKIYDIAGNCYEWTQEANRTDYRAHRGGGYIQRGSLIPASGRSGYTPTNSFDYYSSRPQLYIK